ncbi:IPT/TIG domain-containing protein [Streptomyces sp. NBC_00162]|uniref:IPT/TIG domain-containing protein n=1 Tax=Streptomyces sp. NBC_00162 TaxID=2903629 RepID=UPI00214BD88A|nr:IPT/TIG domain-containing protein [Streptomyces sp. NBC_00162]UUU38163.1 IPT/TIG domain-containing protein [Streptomyces sp. NBC_00162]
MRRTHRRAGILLAALSLCTLPLVHSASRAEAAGPPRCSPGALPVHPGRPGEDPQGQLVALRPDAGPRSGGIQVTLNGSGLTPYTRVLFGSLGPDGCFTGGEAADVAVLSDTALIAITPQWPAAETVSVFAATPCGQLTNPLTFTYLD